MTTPPIAYINGQYVALEDAKVSILDRGFTYGDGVFETLRAYDGKIFRLDRHLERLALSAKALYLELPESTDKLAGIIYETLRRNPWRDAILRINLTRGESAASIGIDAEIPPTLTIVVRPYEPLGASLYRDGINVALIPDSAPRLAGLTQQVKSANFLSHILVRKMAQSRGAWDGVMLDHIGRVCDASTSNIFVVHQNTLKTPRLNEYVLAGITRQEVMELAAGLDLSCREEDLTGDDLKQADEVFLTNTGIEILPVVKIDSQPIGSGQPGPWTQKLHREFLNTVASS